ncbi:MAG: hypothetical protein ACKO4T_06035 [Planctomycetaceae bacterium]
MSLRTTFGILAITVSVAALATAQPPEGRDGPPPDRRDRLRDALDTNGDHTLDADEIKQAATSLAKADTNGDGTIDHDEFRPPLPPPPRGEGGFRGPPPRDEDGPGPREGRPLREGRPVRDGAMRPEGGPRPGAEGGPTPERLVERAMTFDADGDGKLDRAELEKFAAEATQRMRGMMNARGMGPAAERGGGFRPADGPRRRPDAEGGERPERPRRPE